MLAFLPPLSFAALIALFSARSTGSAPAYLIYGMSAYSLAIWLAALPGLTKRVRSAMMNSRILQKAAASPFAGRYRTDPAFRGRVGICPGMAADFLYASLPRRRRSPALERRCYRTTARLLFLLNLPMTGMTVLMARTNSGFPTRGASSICLSSIPFMPWPYPLSIW